MHQLSDTAKLKRLAALCKESDKSITRQQRKQRFNASIIRNQSDMDAWFSEKWCPEYCLESFERSVLYDGNIMYKLVDGCVFDRNHKDAAVIIRSDGSIGYNCFHDSCKDKHWKDFREQFDPLANRKYKQWKGISNAKRS